MDVLVLSLGPVLIGTIFTSILYGIMVLQCYVYYLHYESDRAMIKQFVVFLLLCDTMSMVFNIIMIYDYLVLDFGNVIAVASLNIGASAYPAITAITTAAVQFFYAWRIFIITERLWVALLICIGAIVTSLTGIGTTIAGSIVHEFALLQSELKPIVLLWSLAAVVTDVMITISLVWYLHKSRTGLSGTDGILTRLIRVSIQTGLVTTISVAGSLIAYFASPSAVWLGIGVILGKLYTNSVMSTLNMRNGWGSGDLTNHATSSGTRSQNSRGPNGKRSMNGRVLHSSSEDETRSTEMLRLPFARSQQPCKTSSLRRDEESDLGVVVHEVIDVKAEL